MNAAVPAHGLPQLQVLDLHTASIGFADMFVAAVLGAVLAAGCVRQWPVGLLALSISIGFDTLFLAFDTLPATVPIALALLVSEVVRRRAETRAMERAVPAQARRA